MDTYKHHEMSYPLFLLEYVDVELGFIQAKNYKSNSKNGIQKREKWEQNHNCFR